MRPFLLLAGALSLLYGEFDARGSVTLDEQRYSILPDGKHTDSSTLREQAELKYYRDAWSGRAAFKAQQDAYDLSSDKKNGRSFLRVDEAAVTYEGDAYRAEAGRSVRFWGALEARNIVDGFNPSELRNDPFETDKIGVWNVALSRYTETGSIAAIVKLSEEEQPMAKAPYAYYFFPELVSYDKTLQTESARTRPSLYLSWNGTTDGEVAADFAVIVQNGYDSQRYFAPKAGTFPPVYEQHAYLVDKVMAYATAVSGSTLFKLETLYTDVLDEPLISDYYHVGVGVEHTFEQLYGGSDLGLILEYYRYETLQANRYSDLDLFEAFQDDLFAGLRWSLNDVSDTSVLGGVVWDGRYNEQNWYAQFESRIRETFRLSLDYRYIEPSGTEATAYAMLGRHERFSASLGYFF